VNFMGQILSQIPGKVLALCGTFLAITTLACITFLAATHADSSSLIQVVNTILNFVTLGVAGSAVAVGSTAAANSQKTVEQTNGALDKRIREGVSQALLVHQANQAYLKPTDTTPPIGGGSDG
jgi:hypothetical protein